MKYVKRYHVMSTLLLRLLGQIFLKNAWKCRKLGRGCTSKILLYRSATECAKQRENFITLLGLVDFKNQGQHHLKIKTWTLIGNGIGINKVTSKSEEVHFRGVFPTWILRARDRDHNTLHEEILTLLVGEMVQHFVLKWDQIFQIRNSVLIVHGHIPHQSPPGGYFLKARGSVP